jgi:hypothetical protein
VIAAPALKATLSNFAGDRPAAGDLIEAMVAAAP